MKRNSKNNSGFFIVIEGIDSSGKTLQAKKVVEKLKELGKEVIYADFPTYEKTTFGKLVGNYLRGDLGKRSEIPFEIRCMLYAIDRYQFKEVYEKALEEGKIIVSNRFTQSNMGFQPLEFEGKERENAIKWIELLESRLPQADIVLLLNVNPKTAFELSEQKTIRKYLKGLKRDIHEESINLQIKAAENYLNIAEKKHNWVVINCMNKDGSLKSKEEIFSKVWAHIENYFFNHKN